LCSVLAESIFQLFLPIPQPCKTRTNSLKT
jgi:hypothetical protein